MGFFFFLSWLTLSLKVFAVTTVLKLSSFSCPQFAPLGVAINTGTCFVGVCFLHIKGQRQPAWAGLRFLLISRKPHNSTHLHNPEQSNLGMVHRGSAEVLWLGFEEGLIQ